MSHLPFAESPSGRCSRSIDTPPDTDEYAGMRSCLRVRQNANAGHRAPPQGKRDKLNVQVLRGLLTVWASVFVVMLTACQSLVSTLSTRAFAGSAITGKAHGGRQPVVGASIQIYAAGTRDTGSESTPLLTAPAITDSAGDFTVNAGYSCPSPDAQVYIVATGGNPGLASAPNNLALSLMSAIGPCNQVGQASPVMVNELTTVAAVWPLAGFMKSVSSVGSDVANLTRLADAFSMAKGLVNGESGSAPGLALAANSTVPISKINALGNILSLCVNSGQSVAGTRSPCGALLSSTSMGSGSPPVTVVDAALRIASNPTTNVSKIFDLSPSIAPFQPTLDAAPADWTLPIGVNVAMPQISPANGSFIGSQTVTLADATPLAAIYYTLDGSAPSASSPLYMAPLTLLATTTVRAVAMLTNSASNTNSGTFTMLSGLPQKLAFTSQPGNATIGSGLGPIVIQVEDGSGNLVTNASTTVALTLQANGNSGSLTGHAVVTATNGVATFEDLGVNGPGAGYRLQATSVGVTGDSSSEFAVDPGSVPPTLTPPAPNECQSMWDKSLEYFPGVIAYWPLCEANVSRIGLDYAGQWHMDIADNGQYNLAYNPNKTLHAVASPVPDGETAAQFSDDGGKLGEQGIMLNKNAGSIATWVSNDAPVGDISVASITGATADYPGGVILFTHRSDSHLCYTATLINSTGTPFYAVDCSTTPNTWHPVVMTWDTGSVKLYIDGSLKKSIAYTGHLSDGIFISTLFPSYREQGVTRQMSLAKVTVANRQWDASTVAAYTNPVLSHPPAAGAYVTNQPLGTVHEDLLGYADLATDYSTTALRKAALKGVTDAGFKAVRYSSGFGGITADQGDWHIGAPSQCGGSFQLQDTRNLRPNQSAALNNNLDTFEQYMAGPANLHITYTVNYGSDPRNCSAGGDPTYNGADLVRYANLTKGYGIKFWEIGNEQGGCGSKVDLHPDPTCANGHVGDNGLFTYPTYEPAFYDAMKAVDPTIKIAVPMNATGDFDYIRNFTFNCMSNCHFDAIVDHLYPTSPPLSDSSTIYPDRIASGLARIRGSILAYQTLMLSYGRDPSQIWMTEWDGAPAGNQWSNQSLGAATPLYAAQQLGEYANLGLASAHWWTFSGDNYCNSSNQDQSSGAVYNWHFLQQCGTFSPIYTGPQAGETQVGLQAGDLTPVGHLFQLLSASGFMTEGESSLRLDTDPTGAPWLVGYAATHGSGYAVMLINRDRDQAHTVPVQIAGKASGSSVTQWTYGRAQYDQTYYGNWSVGPVQTLQGPWSGTYQAQVPAWSVTVLVFAP